MKPKDRDRLDRLVKLKRQQTEQDFQQAKASLDLIDSQVASLRQHIATVQTLDGGFGADSLTYQALHLQRLLDNVQVCLELKPQLKVQFEQTRTALAKALLAVEHLSASQNHQ